MGVKYYTQFEYTEESRDTNENGPVSEFSGIVELNRVLEIDSNPHAPTEDEVSSIERMLENNFPNPCKCKIIMIARLH